MVGTEEKAAGPLSYVGCGCGALSGLLLLGGLVTAILILAGAFNYSVVGQAWAGAGSGMCCGFAGLALGIALYFLGRKEADTG